METSDLERKLVAVLAADMAGYSRLMNDDEEATLATLSAHRRIIDELIASGRGHICSTAGDSVLAKFVSVVDAVNCAVAIQQALATANADLPPDRQMHLRIGINVGDIVVQEGDIFGAEVNVAARLEAFAPPRGICVTRSVRDQIRDRSNYKFEDLGEQQLKNIARPVRVFAIICDYEDSATIPDQHLPGNNMITHAHPQENTEAIEIIFWQSVQTGGRAEEYQAYLDRFPDGIFAQLAQARLLEVPATAQPVRPDQSVELAFWNSVQGRDDIAMYQAYLSKYPEGEFRPLAELRSFMLAQGCNSPSRSQPRSYLTRAA